MKTIRPFLPLSALLAMSSVLCRTIIPTTATPTAAPSAAAAAPSATSPPTATPLALALEQIAAPPSRCDESPFGLPGEGLMELAYLPSGFCFNGEIGLFESGGHVYSVQSLGSEGAYFIADITDPERPRFVGAWQWNDFAYTADVKTFQRGDRAYLALSLEPIGRARGLCGVALVEVTDPAKPILLGRFDGNNTGSAKNWCDVHTTEISAGANGDGAFIYISAVDTGDLRVLDIRDLADIREINHYTYPQVGYTSSGGLNFVHDTTIVGGRVYVAYWSAGAIILDRRQLESGAQVTPLNPPQSIAPEGLQVHHTYPTTDGQFLFVEDEVNYSPPTSQLRLYDIRDLKAPKEVASVALDNPYSSPHNLLVSGNLLFVGWYTDGVRVFKYDTSDPAQPSVAPYAFKFVRPGKTTGVFGSDLYDGIYGVRLRDCAPAGQPMICVYASDLTRGLIVLAMKK